MIDWLRLSDEQRKRSITEVEYMEGIRSKAIEKDWWVTLTLKALFTGKYKNDLLFKGGTSLSKCWKLIHRFSEDIDIAVDPSVFGETYQENPSKSFVKKLRRLGCDFTSNQLKQDIETQFEALGLEKGIIEVYAAEVDPKRPDTDPQTLFVKYRSLYDPNPYLEDVVKIEVSTRYLKEPSSKVAIQSILGEFTHNEVYPESPFEVMATEPHRTFLEKAFLLHEEFLRPEQKDIRSKRMSRHLYDLVRMTDEGIDLKALENPNLYAAIIQHRKHYSMLSYMDDYSTLERDKVSFLLPKELIGAYDSDYKTMREEMIYRDAPSFEELLKKLNELAEKFNPKPAEPGLVTEPTVIIESQEFPPYKFYKNAKTAKYTTPRIDLQEKFATLQLFNVNLSPIEVKYKLQLEIIVDNGSLEKPYYFRLADLETNPALVNDLFFNKKGHVEIPLPKGRSWMTIKINPLNDVKEFEIVLACKLVQKNEK